MNGNLLIRKEGKKMESQENRARCCKLKRIKSSYVQWAVQAMTSLANPFMISRSLCSF
jgi:hypothetical protein